MYTVLGLCYGLSFNSIVQQGQGTCTRLIQTSLQMVAKRSQGSTVSSRIIYFLYSLLYDLFTCFQFRCFFLSVLLALFNARGTLTPWTDFVTDGHNLTYFIGTYHINILAINITTLAITRLVNAFKHSTITLYYHTQR